MKRFLLVSCVIFISLQSQAQIPNASFENWQYLPNGVVQPTGWHTNNNSIQAWNVMPDSFANTGFLSAKIEYVSRRGIMYCGFPIANHPLSLDGYTKNMLNVGDTVIVSIQVFSASALVDSGHYEIYGGIATIFLPFSVNISQNTTVADSCVITITGGNIFGSISWFDDLSFSFPTGVDEKFSNAGLTVFPNPTGNELSIINYQLSIEEIEIYNMMGEKVYDTRPMSNIQRLTINVSNLRPGIYILAVRNSKSTVQTRIVKY